MSSRTNIDFNATFDPVKSGRACGMIMGTGFDVTFRELEGPLREAQLIAIEEGTFQGEQWTPPRLLNDEVWTRPLSGGALAVAILNIGDSRYLDTPVSFEPCSYGSSWARRKPWICGHAKKLN
jgi:hypothetical protein